MDSYFQREHNLPTELARLIFEFATLRRDINQVTLRPAQRLPSPYNIIFFQSWSYIIDQMDETRTLVVLDENQRVRAMYIMG